MHIFSTLGVEPWGRYAAGVAELIAVILLPIPRTAFLGALAAAGTMLGTVGAHLGLLGISILDDGGGLFIMDLVALAASVVVLVIRHSQIFCFLKAKCKAPVNQEPEFTQE